MFGHSLSSLIVGRCRRLLSLFWREDTGATAIVTALVMTMLMGFAGLAVEAGLWYGDRRSEQTAADAAALGAAYRIYEAGTNDPDEIEDLEDEIVTAGEESSARNDYTNGEDGVVLTINNAPESGPNAGNDLAVEAILVKPRATMMSSFFLGDSVSISSRAVAVVADSGPFCVLALDPSAGAALRFGGAAELEMEACGIVVNSSASNAMDLIGGAIVGATYADIVGNYTKSSNSTLDLEEGAPNVGAEEVPDPYAHLDVPTGTGCQFGTPGQYKVDKDVTATLSPGRYCGGIKINAGAVVTMNPGNYVMVGGSFDVAGHATVTGSGVTIFLTGSGTNYANVTINADANVTLSAPTSGDYEGLAFFQDRNAPVIDTGAPNKFNGGGTMNISGALYFPRQLIQYSGGNSTGTGCMRMVAYQVEFIGTSNVEFSCAGYNFATVTLRPPTLKE